MATKDVIVSKLPLLGDGELVGRAQRGEVEAFADLFDRHRDRVYTIAYAVLGNPSDAVDVVQETFLRAFGKLSRFHKDGAVSAYLYRTARNAAIDVLRSRKGIQTTTLDEADGSPKPIRDPGDNPEQALRRRTNEEALVLAVSRLSEEHRTVLVMHHIEGLSVDAIAKELSVPAGTVKSRLGRAREALRRKLLGTVDLG
ncbi:MAG: RNA polymerase subunit sigma-24 [Armatimonadota bacterium]